MSISAATRALPLLFCLLTGCRKEPADGVALVGATLIDGEPTTYPDALRARTGGEARKDVDRLVNAGVDFIKIYTRVDPPLLRAILDEAKAFNLKVSGHLGLTDAVTAAAAGIGSIEHMSGVPEATVSDASPLYAAHRQGFFTGWTAFERSWGGLDSAALERVASELAARRVTMVPTLVLHDTFSRLDDPAVLQDTMLREVPEEEQKRWNVPDMVARAHWTGARSHGHELCGRDDLLCRW